jgi:hypothetical protein
MVFTGIFSTAVVSKTAWYYGGEASMLLWDAFPLMNCSDIVLTHWMWTDALHSG